MQCFAIRVNNVIKELELLTYCKEESLKKLNADIALLPSLVKKLHQNLDHYLHFSCRIIFVTFLSFSWRVEVECLIFLFTKIYTSETANFWKSQLDKCLLQVYFSVGKITIQGKDSVQTWIQINIFFQQTSLEYLKSAFLHLLTKNWFMIYPQLVSKKRQFSSKTPQK